jgi:catechol 2,3-dioxygenase-like lactoylglutathione lyase family enzyme
VILRTVDWSEAIGYYGSVLGLPIVHEEPALVAFETGAFRLYVEKGSNHPPIFEFLAADVESTRRELLAAGCTIVEEDPALPRCYIRDPYGLVFDLGQASQ